MELDDTASGGHSLKRVIEYIPNSRTVEESRLLAAHYLWYLVVQDYSLRFLTNISDKLPTLSGLAKIFRNIFAGKSEYIAGLWTGDIINGLCWQRRSGYDDDEEEEEKEEEGEGEEEEKEKDHLLPNITSSSYRGTSFSWVAINGPPSTFLLK
jgi:hypothetical protein